LNLKLKAKLFFEKEVTVRYSTLYNIPADLNLQQKWGEKFISITDTQIDGST